MVGLFGSKSKRSSAVRDWSTGPLVKQSPLAADAPDVLAFAVEAARQADRPGGVDVEKVLAAIDRMLAGQMDAYAGALPGLDAGQMAQMREALYARPDFRFEMFFDGLTYFGSSGIAMCNGLVEQWGTFQSVVVGLVEKGEFDRG
ncbi:hypothetical protein [Streptomyces sp. B21-101]|uniref:hypothetical protein n=1 Tax=Streptomyces sp. B21-101 TaxID=3039415 RepID=UPI002FEEF744